MEAQVGKEERERDDENVVAIPELPRSVTKANERKMEKKFNQSQTQNNCESLLAPSSTHSRKKLYTSYHFFGQNSEKIKVWKNT